eukprot:m.58432 g.58432  ORF g.58432 m.58432 type:complete len:215 (+) comp12865_c0_seq2:415-1059(+)
MAAASVTARLSRAIACSLRLPVSRCTLTVAPAAAASSPATVLGLRHGSRQQHRKAASTLAPPVSLAIPLPTFVAARQSLAPRRTAGHAQSAAITTSAHGLEEGGPDGNASSALAAPGVLRLPMLGSLGSSASVADAAGHVQLALNPLHTADQLAHAIADETGGVLVLFQRNSYLLADVSTTCVMLVSLWSPLVKIGVCLHLELICSQQPIASRN